MSDPPRAAEFFAGIGLMRAGLEAGGFRVVWANDIEPKKEDIYGRNFGAGEYTLGDVRDVRSNDIPDIDLATASFPCTDLSLAGHRSGLGRAAQDHARSDGSSMFWEFARVLDEMADRRPPVLLLENVLGFASSKGGSDLVEAVLTLNELGYSCDLFTIDARHFVPQSRPRLFIVGLANPRPEDHVHGSVSIPPWLARLVLAAPKARLHHRALSPLPAGPPDLNGIVESSESPGLGWWDGHRIDRFVESLSDLNHQRLQTLMRQRNVVRRTAYRRTRQGRAVWEIRPDGIAGCLRTARGGSSKQALVEAGRGELRIRLLTPREYARLMGAPRFELGARTTNALYGLGDAVCVPVIKWLCDHYLAADARAAHLTAVAAD
ncbi:DNA cytosine methyltransferase [soil metagenome]